MHEKVVGDQVEEGVPWNPAKKIPLHTQNRRQCWFYQIFFLDESGGGMPRRVPDMSYSEEHFCTGAKKAKIDR